MKPHTSQPARALLIRSGLRLAAGLAIGLVLGVSASLARADETAWGGSDIVPPEKEDTRNLVHAKLISSRDAVVPGQTFDVGVMLTMKPHWHTYWRNPGEAGMATLIDWKLPEGFSAGEIRWPTPGDYSAGGIVAYGYEDTVLLTVPITAAKKIETDRVRLTASVDWLACKVNCIPGSAKLELVLPVRDRVQPTHAELFRQWQQRLPRALPAGRLVAEGKLAGKDKSDTFQVSIDLAGLVEQTRTAAKDKQTSDGASDVVASCDKSPPPTQPATPAKVEFLPAAGRSLAVENLRVGTEGPRAKVTFKASWYGSGKGPAELFAVLALTDPKSGRRTGWSLAVPLRPAPAKPATDGPADTSAEAKPNSK